jgi:hypothetical protein
MKLCNFDNVKNVFKSISVVLLGKDETTTSINNYNNKSYILWLLHGKWSNTYNGCLKSCEKYTSKLSYYTCNVYYNLWKVILMTLKQFSLSKATINDMIRGLWLNRRIKLLSYYLPEAFVVMSESHVDMARYPWERYEDSFWLQNIRVEISLIKPYFGHIFRS